MKNKHKIGFIAACVASALSASASLQAAPTHDKNVIGYLTQWEAWKGPEAGFTVKGEATQLNVDMDIYSILNFSFIGLAKDGTLHSGDLRNKEIYKEGEVQEPGSLLSTDVYSSWDLPILWGELELLFEYPGDEPWQADLLARVKAQGFEKDGDGWIHTPSGLFGNMPIPLKKAGGAPGLIELANEKGVKVMASLGGWSMSKHFPEMAADPVMKARFLSEIDRLMALGFDGIDIDWEFPGITGMNFTGTPADYPNFEQLMEDIRARIGKDKLLTAAFKADPKALEGFNWERLDKSMDSFNMMTYDFNGGWSDVTGHNSPLFPYPEEEFKGLTLDALRLWMKARGIPSEKINFGAAFYGRGVQTTQATAYLGAPTDKRLVNFSVDGPANSAVDLDNWKAFEGQPNYNYLIKQAGWEHFWDDSAKVPYAVKGKYFLSYDDKDAIREKAQYVVDNGLGGMIIWQVAGDIRCDGEFISYGSKLKQCTNLRSPLAEQIDAVFSANTLPNGTPVLIVPSTQQAESGDMITFGISATDPDGDRLSFSSPDAMVTEQSNSTALVSYQAPVSEEDLVRTIKIEVTDGRATTSKTVVVMVKGAGTGTDENTPPVLTAPVSVEVNAGEVAVFSVSASDAEGDVLTFSSDTGDLVQSGATATISIPTSASPLDSVIPVIVTISDGEASVSATVLVNVKGESAQPDGTWSPDKIYTKGMEVTHEGTRYTAQWWNQNEEPGDGNPVWLEYDDGSVQEWSVTKIYQKDERVLYQGNEYKAKWWTQGDRPETPDSPWVLL